MMPIKTLRPYLLFISLGLVSGCGLDLSGKKASPPKIRHWHGIVFMDKSVSINPQQSYIQDKYNQILTELVNQNLKQKGDRLDIYYLHENTTKAKVWSFTCKSYLNPEDTLQASQADIDMAKNAFSIQLRKEKAAILKKCLSTLAFTNVSSSNKFTDVWASLEVIDKLIDPEEAKEYHVYYLSDMIESMKGPGRRDFHLFPPKDKTQAEAWAIEDAEKIRQNLNLEKFSTLHITIALPFEPDRSSKENNPYVTYYWEKLFEKLGIEESPQEV
jgi:hypothetical protein